MFEEKYEILFEGTSLELGKLFWYISKAKTELNKRLQIPSKINKEQVELSKLEIKDDEIRWWITKKEKDIDEFIKRTKNVKEHAQQLKEESIKLRDNLNFDLNVESEIAVGHLIGKIKKFTEINKNAIKELLSYVKWLYERDVLAPSILFTYRVWGSTRMADKHINIEKDNIEDDLRNVRMATLITLGLMGRYSYTISIILYIDPSVSIGDNDNQRFIASCNMEVLRELAVFFEFLRNSFNNIVLEAEQYNQEILLLHDDEFWIKFIMKARTITETKLWDFKQTLDMWEVKEPSLKAKKSIELCEQIAAYANKNGGVLIIGITDKLREVVGVNDIETKMRTIGSKIKRWSDYYDDFWFLKEIKIQDDVGVTRSCLIIAIAQTDNVVGVKDENNRYSYPIRIETGKENGDFWKLDEQKTRITKDNYDFLKELKQFSKWGL